MDFKYNKKRDIFKLKERSMKDEYSELRSLGAKLALLKR